MALTWNTACFGFPVHDLRFGRAEMTVLRTATRRFRKTKLVEMRRISVALLNLTATEANDLMDEFLTVEHTGVLRFTPPSDSALAGTFEKPSPVPIAISNDAYRMFAKIIEVKGIDVPV